MRYAIRVKDGTFNGCVYLCPALNPGQPGASPQWAFEVRMPHHFESQPRWFADKGEAIGWLQVLRREMPQIQDIDKARVVCRLTHDEAKRKAAATALREMAAELRACCRTDGPILREVERVMQDTNALMLEAKADGLWPLARRGKR